MFSFSNHMDGIELSKIRMIGEKAAAMTAQGKKVVKLQVGEPDFNTPSHIVEAAIASLRNNETHYAPNRGTLELRRAISEKLMADNGVKADPASEILVLNGCAEALYCAAIGLLDRGDEMLIIEPTFINYVQLARMAGAIPVSVHAREENDWLPEIEEIKKAITPKTKMLILNTPTNPTGAVYPEALLREIAELAIKHGFFVVSDEVYEKLIYDDAKHVSIASLPGMEDRAVTINGFSKAYAMTGWRLGYVAACKELTLPMLKVHQYTSTCLPFFVQAGAVDALKNSDADIEAMRMAYMRRRDLLAGWLRESADIELVKPTGTFYMYPNISKSGLDSLTFINRLLEEECVATVADIAFDQQGKNNIRISFASDEENLRIGAEKVRKLVAAGRA